MTIRTKCLCTILLMGLFTPLAACRSTAPVNDPEALARVKGLAVSLTARETGADDSTVRGTVRAKAGEKATSDTLAVALTVCDPWGEVLMQTSAVTSQPFRLRLPGDARGPVMVRAELAQSNAKPIRGEAWIFAGDYGKAVTKLETTAKAQALLLKSQREAAAAGAERLRAERRLAIPEHALAWLGRDHAKPTDNQLIELAYLQRDLATVVAGQDPTEATPGGTHLMAIELSNGTAATSATHVMRFWVHLPADYSQRHDWPLAVFLHGSTSSKDMVETFRGPLAAYPGGVGMPCVAIAPKAERGWNIDDLNLTLDYVLAHFAVNPDRVALLGHSMGGMGTINWMTKSPERFSAYAPMSGAGDPAQAGAYAYVPAWYVHGRKDPAVGVSGALSLMHFVTFFGGSPRATLLPDGDHMAVFSTFEQRDFWTWMTDQRRKPAPAVRPAIAFDKQGLGPLTIEEQPAGAFYAVVSASSYDALAPRDRSWQDIGPRGKLGDALPGVAVDSPLCLRTPNAAAADAATATRFGFFVPSQAPKTADGFDAQSVPMERCIVRLYRGPAEGLPAALEATRESARKAGLQLTGEEWQLLWSAGGRGGAGLRELRLVARPMDEQK